MIKVTYYFFCSLFYFEYFPIAIFLLGSSGAAMNCYVFPSYVEAVKEYCGEKQQCTGLRTANGKRDDEAWTQIVWQNTTVNRSSLFIKE